MNKLAVLGAHLVLYAAIVGLSLGGSSCQAQRSLPREPSVGGAAQRQMNSIRNQAIGRGYSIADVTRLSLNTVQPLQVSNLTGTNVTGQVLRPVGATAANDLTPTVAPRRAGGAAPVSSGPVSKPFSHIDRGPTVSPYLLLFNDDSDSNPGLNYQTLVRPILNQQSINQQVNREQQQINQQLSALAGRNEYNVQGSEQMMATGHAAVFNNTLRYYPQRARR